MLTSTDRYLARLIALPLFGTLVIAAIGPTASMQLGPASAQALALRQATQEISERLFISLHTVKTHARHINSKLGVERRTQAVARAKGLGLLR